MNVEKIPTDDPRLTAYALGELDADESARIAAAIETDPVAKAAVEELRKVAGQLEQALAEEPFATENQPIQLPDWDERKVVAFPRGWMIGIAAAACFAVFVGVRVYSGKTPSVPEQAAVAMNPATVAAPEAKAPAPAEALALAPVVAKTEAQPAETAARTEPANVAPTAAPAVSVAQTTPAPVPVDPAAPRRPMPRPTVSPSGVGDRVAFLETQRGPGRNHRDLSPRLDYGDRPASSAYDFRSSGMGGSEGFVGVAGHPRSSFSARVGTGSYANVRRFLRNGRMPPPDAVRVEEMLNYFSYGSIAPRDQNPLAASLEVAAAPWNPSHRLVRIGVQSRELANHERMPANFVFLVDVSGSMKTTGKLPLVKDSLRMMLQNLESTDRVAIVTYAGQSGLALPSTPVQRRDEILAAIDGLQPEGASDNTEGLQLAFDVAKGSFLKQGNNRVILCTDGDVEFRARPTEVARLVEDRAKEGLYFSVLGFGMENPHHPTLETLAAKGHGSYAYVDSRAEAQNMLSEQMGNAVVAVARDVRFQVEFNPAQAKSYRLIGYEDHAPSAAEVAAAKAEGSEMPAGYRVTALYEVVPVDASDWAETSADSHAVEPRRRELLTLKVHYKLPTVEVPRNMEIPLVDTGADFSVASKDFKFAAAVAGFGMLLQESPHKGNATYDNVLRWAEEGQDKEDKSGKQTEFIDLVKKAKGALVE